MDQRKEELIERIDVLHERVCNVQMDLFAVLADADRAEVWRDSGARDMAHWVCMRYGISEWKARRWVSTAHALEGLPLISLAFASGELGIDKVVEITRFATSETEAKLIPWARGVSCAAIRRRADLTLRQEIHEVQEADRSRFVSWWYFDEGKRFGLEADLPAAQGAVVARALDRLADRLPVMPGEEDAYSVGARRADALVAVCSARIADDADPDRATVVVHAPLQAILSGDGGCEIEGGPVIHPEIARRLLCDGRLQTIIEDGAGQPVGMGRLFREPREWMMRQLRWRDHHECTFDACGTRQFLRAHHIVWWGHGGPTDLDNLILVCNFHHKLVHEYGWSVRRNPDGTVEWFRPDGTRYRAGPAPPTEKSEPQSVLPALSAAGF